ncbi:MAG: ester cyclase [Saprospiraceae bacterium]
MRQFLEGYFRDVWINRDMDAARNIYLHPNTYNVNFPDVPPGIEGIMRQVDAFLTGFPDAQFELHDFIVEGNIVALRIVLTATHLGVYRDIPATGKTVKLDDFVFIEMKDNKIWKFYPLFDMEAVLRDAQ